VTRIDELIADLCPRGVEYRALGDIGTVVRGKRFVKADMVDEGVPCIHYGELYTKYGIAASKSASFVTAELAANLRFAMPGDVIIASAGETIEDIGKSVAWLGAEPIAIHDACFAFTSDLDPKYVSYFFASHGFRDQIRQDISSSKVSSISTKDVAKALIPTPPPDVQREIVRTLDRLTQLEAELESELEAELEARRRQYEHYRSVLLSSSDHAGVRDVSLGEIIRLKFGARITKRDDAGTIYPVYGGGGESFRTDSFNREDEWVISRFAMSANCVRRVAGKFWMLDSGFTFDVTNASIDKDFVGQLFLSMQPIIFATSTQSAQKNIDVDGFKRLRVQVPSLDMQRQVVSKLANFDEVVNDLSSGLPAELNARRKQYVYYREKLLTFEEVNV